MISVIVPVYNVEEYLPHCLNSILAQGTNDIEIILVDDGSTDSSGYICDQYAESFDSIKVIHQENLGLSMARNIGIENSGGDFITFVDSDDMLTKSFISSAEKLANLYDADLVAFSYIRCKDNSQWPIDVQYTSECDCCVYEDPNQKMQNFLIGNNIGTAAWGKLYRKELFDQIRYPEGKYHEDVYTTYKIVDKASRVVTTSKIGYIYRKSRKSITANAFSIRRLDCVDGKIEQLSFILSKYPSLQKEAEAGVIYACNQCLILMLRDNYREQTTIRHLQYLYREYGKSYVKISQSLLGKLFAITAMTNITILYYISRCRKQQFIW